MARLVNTRETKRYTEKTNYISGKGNDKKRNEERSLEANEAAHKKAEEQVRAYSNDHDGSSLCNSSMLCVRRTPNSLVLLSDRRVSIL